ncbi:exodeoxyribonuclease VII large subunit [Pigmentiphaga litoralis]|uniref:Exodeoxyribonuclease 7 large subunit n=1 Tax=Pigmentiphaga litoralis TaxID=516702 RepID=A0A7Y9IZ52_9BURK|nr:exodeoxyribonuclease VII large subunit [Pigmentiphaga litoralis]NYE26764.1 exodeoxyribonuclease VII large subunit [Pigmentiphaga litoralis]NYE85826.1 exodeoxyribonuclease VII large subunit [Pigmentiphaga litoralis]
MSATFAGAHDGMSREILTISQLNRAVASLLERSIPLMWVRGEVSNFTAAASGHWYFTLKDGTAAARGVMFRGRASLVGFTPRNGDQIEVRCKVSLYEPRGDYQLQVEAMRRAGQGDLFEAFVRLKEKLTAEGLFDADRKRAPVALPKAIGVITSLQAAALRDVLTALARRAPHVPVIVYPAPVQGEEAAGRLVQAIVTANRRKEVDTLLLVRGGGSIEDLWSFNNEALARAIHDSAITIICGVGHETDFTIADFVADLRAPTPTAAAELACLPQSQWLARVAQAASTLTRLQQRRLERMAQRVDRLAGQLVSPRQRLERQRERLTTLSRDLSGAWRHLQRDRAGHVALLRQRLTTELPDPGACQVQVRELGRRLRLAEAAYLARLAARVDGRLDQLRALGPQQTLARGYAIARDGRGRIVREAAALKVGETVDLHFSEGTAKATVAQIAPDLPLA